MIDAANAAFLIAAEPEIGAAVRAILIDHPDHAAGVAERVQLLAHPRSSSAARRLPAILPTARPATRTGAATRPSACPPRFRSGICCPRRGALRSSGGRYCFSASLAQE